MRSPRTVSYSRRAAISRPSIKWGASVFLVLLLVAYATVSYFIATGVTKAERKQQEAHPTDHGLLFENVEFLSRRGDVTLRGWFLPAEANSPTLIFVHGIGSIRSGNNATELAAAMVELGFSVLLFDLRAHGTSEGEKISGGIFESQDVLGAFDFVLAQGTLPERIGVLGFSMGAGTSVLAAADEPRIQALVIDSTYASATDLISQETARKTPFPEWLVSIFVPGANFLADIIYDIDLDALAPEARVAELDYPVMVIHGTADTRIPVDHGLRVYRAAHPDSVLWTVPDVEHVDAFLDHPDNYVQRVAGYFIHRFGSDPPEPSP